MEQTIIIPKSRYEELLGYEAMVKGVERTGEEKLETLHQMVKDVINSSRTWKEKYRIIFSPAIEGRIRKFAKGFNPKLTHICDATDVMIFASALENYMSNLN